MPLDARRTIFLLVNACSIWQPGRLQLTTRLPAYLASTIQHLASHPALYQANAGKEALFIMQGGRVDNGSGGILGHSPTLMCKFSAISGDRRSSGLRQNSVNEDDENRAAVHCAIVSNQWVLRACISHRSRKGWWVSQCRSC